MVDIQAFLASDLIFVYFLSFIVLLVLVFELLSRIFVDKKVSMLIALIITTYVFLTNGYLIISKILSLSTVGMVILVFIIIVIIMFLRFWKGLKQNFPRDFV